MRELFVDLLAQIGKPLEMRLALRLGRPLEEVEQPGRREAEAMRRRGEAYGGTECGSI